jgi:hypothetical protein
MSSCSQPNKQDADGLEAAVDQAIAACDGDMRSTIRALMVANDYLEFEVSELMKAVSHAYVRGKFQTYSGQEQTMADVTYFVALPFVAADDGIAAGEPTECFNPTAVVLRASTQLMLKTMFEIITTMADDPDGYRSDMRTKLLEIVDTMPLAPRERKVRAFVKETVGNLLINQRPN